MKAYCLFDNVHLKDVTKLDSYKERVGAVVQKFNGEYLVLGGKIRAIEGNWEPSTLVMIAFPDFETANAWYDSKEYRELKALRMEGVDCNAVIMEGFDSTLMQA